MSNVIQLPAVVNTEDRLADTFAELARVVRQAGRSTGANADLDFAMVEGNVYDLLFQLEEVALAEIFAAAAPNSEFVTVDGVVYKRMRDESRAEYFALHAKVEVWRHLYRQVGVRNGPTVDPVALRCGLVEGRYTPQAAVAAAHMAQAVPTREGGEICESMRVLPYSRSQNYRVANAVGARWDDIREPAEEALIEDFDIPEGTAAISVSADRISLPMAEDREPTAQEVARGVQRPLTVQGRMAWVGCLTLHDDKGAALFTFRYGHTAGLGRQRLVDSLSGDLAALMSQEPDLDLVTLADGASDVQDVLEQATVGFTVRARLTDFYHLTEHLAAAKKAARVEGDEILSDCAPARRR